MRTKRSTLGARPSDIKGDRVTTQNEREAVDQARQEAERETIAALRSFTGIAGYTPSLELPEHSSYLKYEQQLREGLAVWSARLEATAKNLDRRIELRDDAGRRLDEEQQRRQGERAGSGVAARVLGAVQDVSFQEKRDLSKRQRDVVAGEQELQRCESRVGEISGELELVSTWLERMFSAVAAARAEREQRRDEEELARVQAGRDVSPRGYSVYTAENFVSEDERRLARWQQNHPVLEGATIIHRLRADGFDSNASGNWIVVWNWRTNETFVELTGAGQPPLVWLLGTKISTLQQATDLFDPLLPRINERNSLALAFDAYDAY